MDSRTLEGMGKRLSGIPPQGDGFKEGPPAVEPLGGQDAVLPVLPKIDRELLYLLMDLRGVVGVLPEEKDRLS